MSHRGSPATRLMVCWVAHGCIQSVVLTAFPTDVEREVVRLQRLDVRPDVRDAEHIGVEVRKPIASGQDVMDVDLHLSGAILVPYRVERMDLGVMGRINQQALASP